MKTALRWKHEPLARMGASTGAKSTGVKEAGNAYHRKVYGLLRVHTRLFMPGWTLLVEPWYRTVDKNVHSLRSPDTVLLHEESSTAIVVEVKLNWKNGRDVKLITEYLPIVQSAHNLDMVWPLLVTQCLRGWKGKPLLGLSQLQDACSWQPGDPTPLMLLLK